jgi:uncharacterized protein
VNEGPIRAVVDTNVWISAVLNRMGPPARVLAELLTGRFTAVVSEVMLAELRRVMYRPRIRRRWQSYPDDMQIVLAAVEERSLFISPAGTLRLCRDPDDDIVLETAILASAAFLVTRDDDIKRDSDVIRHLQENGVAVVSVAQFLQILEPERG